MEFVFPVKQKMNEIENEGKLDEQSGLFQELLNYRDIDTSKIAGAAFKKGLFYPCELYKEL